MPLVADWWFLSRRLERSDLALVAPERITLGVLLLNEGVSSNVSGQKGGSLRGIGALGDLGEGGAELVLAVLARNVATVARHLRPLVAQ